MKFMYEYLILAGHVPYVLIGAGTASFAAAKAIREADPQAKVTSFRYFTVFLHSLTHSLTL